MIRALDLRFPDSVSIAHAADEPDLQEALARRARISDKLFRLVSPTLVRYEGPGEDARAMTYYRQRMEGWLGASLEDLHARRQLFFCGAVTRARGDGYDC